MVIFKEYDGNVSDLVCYYQITGHLLFEIKLGENFSRKVRYCSAVNNTGPDYFSYINIVDWYSVSNIMFIVEINNIQILRAYLHNSFFTVPNWYKPHLIPGKYFFPWKDFSFLLGRFLA